MSRCHATIEQTKDKKDWIIRDGQWNPAMCQWKNSRNGTYVNSWPVGQNGYYLSLGDIITMGDITLRFENY
jgi:pSer/pThr/pTyr-binding forkhead associated (FHA) protein